MQRLKTILAGAILAFQGLAPLAHANETVTYTYDALGRLVKVVTNGTAVTNGQTVDTVFDPAGNRTNYTVNGAVSPVISLTNSPSVNEGGTLTFTLAVTPAPPVPVAVTYTTTNGTALSPTNYTATSGTANFATGQTSAQVTVATIDDKLRTASLAMTLNLTAPTAGATLGTATATGTVVNTTPLIVVAPLNGYSLVFVP